MLVCMLAATGATWAESYTIKFGNGVKSATPLTETVKAATAIAEGTDYVTAQPFTAVEGNAYYGDAQNCIRTGKSGTAATLSIALSDAGKVKATTIVVNAKNYGGKNNGATLSVNGKAAQETSDEAAADYTFTINDNISAITLTSSKAVFIYSITVNYENSGEPTPEPAKYDVEIADGIQNGTVTASATSATAGTTITLTATPAEGYTFGEWDVKGEDNKVITVTNNQFAMPEQNVYVSATFNKKPADTNVYASLAELVAAGEPTEAGEEVTVTLTNDEIVDFYVTSQGYRNGIYFMVGDQKMELYYRNVPKEWVKGGKVSGTITCPWKNYKGTWELAPEQDTWSWDKLTYTAPEGGGEQPGDEPKDEHTFDLTEDQTVIANEQQMMWSNDIVTIIADKAASSTPANNYYPGNPTKRTSTRFYTGSTLTITPVAGYSITSIVCEATTAGYTTALVESEWTNATATNKDQVITIIPENGCAPITAKLAKTVGLTYIDITYEATEKAAIVISEACKDGEAYYATFSLSTPWEVPAGLTVSEIAIEDGALKLAQYADGAVVPANTGVLVSAVEPGCYEATLSLQSASASVLGELNALRPSTEAMEGDAKFYRLTMHKGEQIGFWYGAKDGAAFGIAANKAYLAIPAEANIKAEGLWFGEATAIANVKATSNENIFNLAGQRVQNTTKGIYVKDGKKFIVK